MYHFQLPDSTAEDESVLMSLIVLLGLFGHMFETALLVTAIFVLSFTLSLSFALFRPPYVHNKP